MAETRKNYDGSPGWLRNLLMSVVLIVWGGYMAVSVLAMKQVPPLPLWGVPGATYALLSGKRPSFKFTKDPEDD